MSESRLSAIDRYCTFCGAALPTGGVIPERFGESFCSEAHADEFVKVVRAARTATAARAADASAGACGGPATGWKDRLKKSLCWGAPLLLLLALPLMSSGGLAATGGSVLSVLALLACPLGMFFMMRSMMRMGQRAHDADAEHGTQKGEPQGGPR